MVRAGDVVLASDISVQACRVNRTAVLSIPDSSATTVTFDAELFDTDGMHSTVTNSSRITINTAGIYVVGFVGTMQARSDYVRTLSEIILNGAVSIGRQGGPGTSSSVPQTMNASCVYQFAAGDYVEVTVFQDNSANAASNLEQVSDRSPQFYAARIGS
jgi:hypothetical protein